jgi:hypothetical protein
MGVKRLGWDMGLFKQGQTNEYGTQELRKKFKDKFGIKTEKSRVSE